VTDARDELLGTVIAIAPAPASDSAPDPQAALARVAREVIRAGDAGAAAEQCRRTCPELIVLLEAGPPEKILETLRAVRSAIPEVPPVVLTTSPSIESAVAFVREGARDYVQLPLSGERADRLRAAAGGVPAGEDEARFFSPRCPPDVRMVGRSRAMERALETLHLVAGSNCNPVLVLGETGTGKELAARAVHGLRARARGASPAGPFVAVNCAALTANLLESELFGHVKGAFTGADRDKVGLFQAAEDGTIFLDEISEMPSELQAKLLRVLQEKTFRRVGGTRDIATRSTIIASSNRDLSREVAEGRFRKDLYYRLAIFPIALPPLRDPDRRDDICLLAEHFIRTSAAVVHRRCKGLSDEARDALMAHDWPGNVRELRNVIDRAMIVEQGERLEPSSISIEPDGAPGTGEERRDRGDFSLEAAEREFILRALKETGWQRTRAAALLGITRATLHAKLKRYDIRPPDRPSSPKEPAGSSARS